MQSSTSHICVCPLSTSSHHPLALTYSSLYRSLHYYYYYYFFYYFVLRISCLVSYTTVQEHCVGHLPILDLVVLSALVAYNLFLPFTLFYVGILATTRCVTNSAVSCRMGSWKRSTRRLRAFICSFPVSTFLFRLIYLFFKFMIPISTRLGRTQQPPPLLLLSAKTQAYMRDKSR